MRHLLRVLILLGLVHIASTFANSATSVARTHLGQMGSVQTAGCVACHKSKLNLTMKPNRNQVAMNLKRDKVAGNFKIESVTDVAPPIAIVRPEIDTSSQITLTEYIQVVCKANKHLRGLSAPLGGMEKGCKEISKLITRASLTGLLGYANGGGSMNVQGEEQKKLDIIANDVLKKALTTTGTVGIIASEEEDHPYFHKDAYKIPGQCDSSDARTLRNAGLMIVMAYG